MPTRSGQHDRRRRRRQILSAIIEIARARNVLDAAQATLLRAAERAGIPYRKRVRTAAGLLTEIGVPAAVAHRTARNGHHAERLTPIARGLRDGSLSAEMADAIGKGVTAVEKRVGLDETDRTTLTRKLLVQTTPGEVAATARREAIRLTADSDDPDLVPAAENPDLNEMVVTTDEEGRITATADLDVLTG
ncbi:HNH endonuclease, partial [Gordonia sp. HY002]|nr:HNH endonuclease [Gordonia zhenghanii]